MLEVDPLTDSPFHDGEQLVQSRLGVRDQIGPWARRVVRRYLPEEHRAFYAQLPFLAVAGRDGGGRPWATLLVGEPGFASSPNPGTLRLAAVPGSGDPLEDGLRTGSDVGILGIELESRRRNRVNGRVVGRSGADLLLAVEQSFGNCPQYITERRWSRAPETEPALGIRSATLGHDARAVIERADTFFIASGWRDRGESETYGMDASHRGGAPGFVEVTSDRELVFPDYAGNNHFNTLGNLVKDPRAGLLFVDFASGDVLQLTGRTRIDWGSPEVERFPGARRLIHFEIADVVWRPRALAIRWEAPGCAVRELRLVEKRAESADVTSFVFRARDDGPLPAFRAGQHLPIELRAEGVETPLLRTYSLSGPPDAGQYRISVKREPHGLVSRFLHDSLEPGAVVSARAPQGRFVLRPADRPVVLVSAGVGLTPLVSMLHEAVRQHRPVWFVHGARDGDHRPLRAEVERLARSPRVNLHVAYSRPRAGEAAADSHSTGRIDAALLEKLLPGLDADFYLCGPVAFMADIETGLVARGVADRRIHSESFGGSG